MCVGCSSVSDRREQAEAGFLRVQAGAGVQDSARVAEVSSSGRGIAGSFEVERDCSVYR